METFSVRGSVRYGWETFKKRPWYLIGVAALIGIINLIIPGPSEDSSMEATVALGLISFLLGSLLQLGATNIALKAHDNVEEVRVKDLWMPHLFLKYLLATILTGIVLGIAFLIPIAAGYILYTMYGIAGLAAVVLFIPGIILSIALAFVGYGIIDKNLGPIDSIKESLRLTKGNRWKLFLLMLTFVAIALLGVICLLVGLLVALPVIAIAMAHAYRVIDAQKSSIVAA